MAAQAPFPPSTADPPVLEARDLFHIYQQRDAAVRSRPAALLRG